MTLANPSSPPTLLSLRERRARIAAGQTTHEALVAQALEAERTAYNIPPRYSTFESFKQSRVNFILTKLGRK